MDKDRTDCLSPIDLVRHARAGAMRLTAPAGLDHSSARPGRGDQPRHPPWPAIRLSAGRVSAPGALRALRNALQLRMIQDSMSMNDLESKP